MFRLLKNLFSRSPQAPAPQAVPSGYSNGRDFSASDLPAGTLPATPPQVRSHAASSQPRARGVQVSLQGILANLPLELQPHVLQTDVGSLSISVPLEKVLAQLSKGTVRIPFGEVRQAAPSVFTNDSERDRVLVMLPLSEIVPRLNPALIQRRRVQKHVEVPREISSPFDQENQGLIFSVGPSRSDAPAAPVPAAPSLSAGRKSAVAAPLSLTPKPSAPKLGSEQSTPGRLSFSLTPRPVNGTPAVPPAVPVKPQPSNHTAPPVPAAASLTELPPQTKETQALNKNNAPAVASVEAMPAPIAFNLPQAKPSPVPEVPVATARVNANSLPTPAAPSLPCSFDQKPVTPVTGHQVVSPSSAPAVLSAQPKAPAVPVEVMMLPLAKLSESWPEGIREEIQTHNLGSASVALPVDRLESGLRQGRIVIPWALVRSWIVPAATQLPSSHDQTDLELPLSFVAPAFLSRKQQKSAPQQKVSVDEDIPNLFFGFPQPDAPTGAGAKLGDSNYFERESTSESASGTSKTKQGTQLGTRSAGKHLTPNEVVSRAAVLPGVDGALIALPDGLMVASRLAPEVNGETLAAFLPSIFGKVSQCTKELRMGELNNLNFTVGNIPWKIYRVNAIFFAAFGRAEEPLPTVQLAALAAELDHKPR